MSVFVVRYKSEEGQNLLTLTVKASNGVEATERVKREFPCLSQVPLEVEILRGVSNKEADLV